MFITNEDFESICNLADKSRSVLYEDQSGENLARLATALADADITIRRLVEKKEKDNKRKAEYIAEKRKINPRYGGNDKRKYKD